MANSLPHVVTYWVRWTEIDGTKFIAGYTNSDLQKEEDITTPYMEITEVQWKDALAINATEIDSSSNLIAGETQVSIYNVASGEILSSVSWRGYSVEVGEDVVSGAYSGDTKYVSAGVVTDRPLSAIAVDKVVGSPLELFTFTGAIVGSDFKLTTNDPFTVNVFDSYEEFTVSESTIEFSSPRRGTFDVEITEVYPIQNYTVQIEVGPI